MTSKFKIINIITGEYYQSKDEFNSYQEAKVYLMEHLENFLPGEYIISEVFKKETPLKLEK